MTSYDWQPRHFLKALMVVRWIWQRRLCIFLWSLNGTRKTLARTAMRWHPSAYHIKKYLQFLETFEILVGNECFENVLYPFQKMYFFTINQTFWFFKKCFTLNFVRISYSLCSHLKSNLLFIKQSDISSYTHMTCICTHACVYPHAQKFG